MTAHTLPNPTDTMMTPARAASYIAALEARTGRTVERFTLLADGGLEFQLETGTGPSNPADLVDMSE